MSLYFSFVLITASFPCLEPLILQAVCRSEAGNAMKLMYETAYSLIQARIQSKQPPPVSGAAVMIIIITQKAATALEPLTTHPDEWAEPSHK